MKLKPIFLIVLVAFLHGAALGQRNAARIIYDDGSEQVVGASTQPTPPQWPVLANQSRLRVGLTSQYSYNTWWLYADAAKSAYPPALKGTVWEHLIFTKQIAAQGTYTLLTTNDVTPSAKEANVVIAPQGPKTFGVTLPQGQSELTLRYSADPGFVRLMRPGHIPTDLFNREALIQLKPFGGIRCMDLRGTNGSKETTWDSRPKFTDQTWGVACPWEVVVALANQTGKDVWINIPHAADDAYVAGVRDLFQSTCRTDVNVYVEYSNEITFNYRDVFAVQFKYLTARANAAIVAGEPTVIRLNSGNVSVDYTRWACYAQRVVEIQKIMGPRFKMVLSGHIVNPSILKTELEYIARVHGEPKQFIHAIATAPYGGIDSPSPYPDQRRQNKELSRKYALLNFYYEEGFHNTTGGQAMLDKHAAPDADQKTTAYLDAVMPDADQGYWFVIGSLWSVDGDNVSLWGWTRGTFPGAMDEPKYQAAKRWAERVKQ